MLKTIEHIMQAGIVFVKASLKRKERECQIIAPSMHSCCHRWSNSEIFAPIMHSRKNMKMC